MEQVITTERLPIKMWIKDIEDGAVEQAKNLANLPFAFKHVAIMPDSHQGYGMPIGGVLATKNVIIPNAVGVDIGCGMCSVRTDLTHIEKDDLKKILGIIRKTIPVGFNHHKKQQDTKWMPDVPAHSNLWDLVVGDELQKGLYQIGTLGGGNHFIEIQEGSDGFIWIMIHSGSRNVGYTVAKHYNKLAQELNDRWYSNVPKDLAFLPNETQEYNNYVDEMNFCIDFALYNRKLMMHRVKEAFVEVMKDVSFPEFINKPHNFATLENHFGTNVMVHRKGACRAREDELGMIPSSQGTTSYIVKGKGNRLSFHSCSHGAGRVMSRTKARETLDLQEEVKRLDEQGILHSIRHKKDLDEAPSSYKDMDEVMACQEDLVDIVVELKPLATIKG